MITRDTYPHAAIAHARVQAFRNPIVLPANGFNGGPIIPNDDLQMLRHCRWRRPVDRCESGLDFSNTIAGEWNYLGPIYDHFGHVMSEMIHRVIPSRIIFGHDKWLAVGAINKRSTEYSDLPNVYRQALTAVGITKENLLIVNSDSVVERLNICEQGAQLGAGPTKDYCQALTLFSNTMLDEHFKQQARSRYVYVTRTGLPLQGNFLGESFVEQLFSDAGFEVFRPEDHALIVQMDVYRKADVLVFSEGSACHGVELLGALGEVVLLVRRQNHRAIWQRVLAPRAVIYEEICCEELVGSAVLSREDGRPREDYAQYRFDIEKLASRLNELEIETVPRVDRLVYLQRCESDLAAHIDAVRKTETLLLAGPEDIAGMFSSLSAARGAEPEAVSVEGHVSDVISADHQGANSRTVFNKFRAMGGRRRVAVFESKGLSWMVHPIGTSDGRYCSDTIAVSDHMTRQALNGQSDVVGARCDLWRMLGGDIDLSFVERHLIEDVLADFIRAERNSEDQSVIAINNCVPTDSTVATRVNNRLERPYHADWWTGDAWKIIPILRYYRPDLRMQVLDSRPVGLVLIEGLDPSSTILTDRYEEICQQWLGASLVDYGLRRFLREAKTTSSARYLVRTWRHASRVAS